MNRLRNFTKLDQNFLTSSSENPVNEWHFTNHILLTLACTSLQTNI